MPTSSQPHTLPEVGRVWRLLGALAVDGEMSDLDDLWTQARRSSGRGPLSLDAKICARILVFPCPQTL